MCDCWCVRGVCVACAGFVQFVDDHAAGNCALVTHNGSRLGFQHLAHTLDRAKLRLPVACAYAVDALTLARKATKAGLWSAPLADHKLSTLFKHVTGRALEKARDATAAAAAALVRVMACDVMRGLLLTFVMSWEKFVERERRIGALRAALDADIQTNGGVASADEEGTEEGGMAVYSDELQEASGHFLDAPYAKSSSSSSSSSTGAGAGAGAGTSGDGDGDDDGDGWVDVATPIVRSPAGLFQAAGITPGATSRRLFQTAQAAFDSLFRGVEALLVRHTNLYATQKRAARRIKAFLAYAARRRRGMGSSCGVWCVGDLAWVPVTRRDIRVWFACTLQLALIRSAAVDVDFMFSGDPLTPGTQFRRFITWKRLQQIWRNMHAADATATPRKLSPAYDPLYKIREMMNLAMDAWQSAYEPGAVVGVEESLLLFKGPSTFRGIMTDSYPVGLKLLVLAAADPAYVLAFDVKTEAHSRASEGVAESTKATMHLLRRAKLLHTQRSVCIANDYTSMELVRELRREGLYSCGFLNTARVPRSALMARRARGSWKEKLHRETGTVCTAWDDHPVVYFLSNCCKSEGEPVTTLVAGKGRVSVNCPNAVHVFNAGIRDVEEEVRLLWATACGVVVHHVHSSTMCTAACR